MKSKGWLWPACAVIGTLGLLLIACALTVGGFWIARQNPALKQALLEMVATDTPTASPTATETATPVPPTATPSPTVTPTSTPVTPAVLDAPTTNTPAVTLTPTGTDTPFPTDTSVPSPTRTATIVAKPTGTTAPKVSAAATITTTAATTSTAALTSTTAVTSTTVATPTVSAIPFATIGSRAVLSPAGSAVTGSAVLFAPREFTMIKFNYDGQCPIVDIRLGMQGFAKPPVAVLMYLQPRTYKDESFPMPIPANLAPNSANALFVYCDTQDKMLAWGPLVPPQ
jgi:hypothetical protein